MDLSTFEFIAGVGTVLVVIGVMSEGAEILIKISKRPSARGWIEKEGSRRLLFTLIWLTRRMHPIMLWIEGIGLGIVIAGLAIEWFGTNGANRIQSNENAELASSNTNLMLRIEELRSKNLALEKELQPRTITDEQRAIFKSLLSDPNLIKSNCTVFIKVDQNNIEGRVFTGQIKAILTECGFSVNIIAPIMLSSSEPQNVDFGLRFFTHFPVSDEATKLLDAFRKAIPDEVPIDGPSGKILVADTAGQGLYINVDFKPLPAN
jgi:hypothetical protein